MVNRIEGAQLGPDDKCLDEDRRRPHDTSEDDSSQISQVNKKYP